MKKGKRYCVSLDLTSRDYLALRARAEEEGVPIWSIVRRGLYRELGKPVRRQVIPLELRQAYRELCGQLGRLGNNVNQIARKLNAGASLDGEALKVLRNVEKAMAVLAVRWSPARVLEEFRAGEEGKEAGHEESLAV